MPIFWDTLLIIPKLLFLGVLRFRRVWKPAQGHTDKIQNQIYLTLSLNSFSRVQQFSNSIYLGSLHPLLIFLKFPGWAWRSSQFEDHLWGPLYFPKSKQNGPMRLSLWAGPKFTIHLKQLVSHCILHHACLISNQVFWHLNRKSPLFIGQISVMRQHLFCDYMHCRLLWCYALSHTVAAEKQNLGIFHLILYRNTRNICLSPAHVAW